jgi:allantoinase
MPWDVLIRDGQVVTPEGVRPLDVAVEAGTIVELAPGLRGNAREQVNAAGLHVFPGLIDAHVHFNEPGRTEWEGFDTGSAALAAGGGTCFFDMPLNSSPPTLDGPSFDLKRAAAEASSRTDFALWGGLTPGNLDRMEELAERGVVGFKAFMSNSGIEDFPHADDYTLYRGMQIAAKLGLVVAVHAENDAITAGLAAEAKNKGRTGIKDYVRSRPVLAEVEAIRRAITIAEDTRCKLHVVHVSSGAGAAALEAAELQSSADVTFETCPHYLLLTQEDLPRLGALAKCAPPLRDAGDVEQLRSQFRLGRIEFVASDHSPAPPEMKLADDFFDVWGGIAGVQSTLATMLSLFREPSPHWLAAVAAYTATLVADRFGVVGKGVIRLRADADLSLVDIGAQYTLTRDMLLDRHKLSPYVGRTFRGVVRRTLVRGHTVFQDGRTVGSFRGRLVTPDRKGAARA